MTERSQRENDPFSRKSVRQALRTWDNLPNLGEHPLASLKIVERQHRTRRRPDTPADRGLSLRGVLRAAIDTLKPEGDTPDYEDRRWRSYSILQEEFIKGRKPSYLAVVMGEMAPRTYQHAQGDAIDELAGILRQWEDEIGSVLTDQNRQVPFLCPSRQAYRLVGRYTLLEELKGQLFMGGSLALCALNGLPGVGKTALAIELAHDEEILTHFHDGVLWAGVGRQPQLASLLSTWALALGIPPGDVAKLLTLEAQAQAIHTAIGMRRMLLVIDDVWRIEDAQVFCVGGPNCARLITTRSAAVARDFAEERAIIVPELSMAGSILLLGQLAPRVAEMEPDSAQELVQAVGGLPLAIILIARHVRQEESKGKHPLSALRRLREVERRLMLAQSQPLVGSHPSLPAGSTLSLLAAIQISDEALEEPARRALLALALFPPKPNTFAKEAALAVAATSPEILNRLLDSGLLESTGPDRCTVHQTISDYARLRLADETVAQRMVEYFVRYVESHADEYDLLERDTDNILTALHLAYDRCLHAALIRGANASFRFLTARSLYDAAELHLGRAQQAAESLSDSRGLSTTLFHLGQIAAVHGNYAQAEERLRAGLDVAYVVKDPMIVGDLLQGLGTAIARRGDHAQAEQCLLEALALARQAGDDHRICNTLRALGGTAITLGDYDRAQDYLVQSLVLAREIADHGTSSAVLQNLGALAFNRGDYDQAEKHFQEGLTIARKLENHANTCYLLNNLGAIAIDVRKDYDLGEQYCLEALAVARKMCYRESMSASLGNLGDIATNQGNFDQAAEYLREGLAMAREMGHHWLISGIANQFGELYLKQQQPDLAAVAFVESHTAAQEGGYQDMACIALYGSARTAAMQSRIADALAMGQESLVLLRSINHHRAAEVEAWMAGLPGSKPC